MVLTRDKGILANETFIAGSSTFQKDISFVAGLVSERALFLGIPTHISNTAFQTSASSKIFFKFCSAWALSNPTSEIPTCP
jgi:hypothetical protein